MSEFTEGISDRYNHVHDRINESVIGAGRLPETVKLLVVTKGQPVDRIVQAYQAGARLLGENYPE